MTEEQVTELTVTVPTAELGRLDQLIKEGRFPDRQSALREAFKRLLEAETEEMLDARYYAGYARIPDGDDPDLDAQISGFAAYSVAEEPW